LSGLKIIWKDSAFNPKKIFSIEFNKLYFFRIPDYFRISESRDIGDLLNDCGMLFAFNKNRRGSSA